MTKFVSENELTLCRAILDDPPPWCMCEKNILLDSIIAQISDAICKPKALNADYTPPLRHAYMGCTVDSQCYCLFM